MHVDTNFVVAKGRERTLDYPEVFQSESFDLCDEICLFLRRTHWRLHLVAAANRWTLRPHSDAKNLPSVDATFHAGKLASAVASLFRLRNGSARPTLVFSQEAKSVANQRPSASLRSGVLAVNSTRKSMKARILSGKYFRLTYTIYSIGPCTG